MNKYIFNIKGNINKYYLCIYFIDEFYIELLFKYFLYCLKKLYFSIFYYRILV